MNVSVPASMTWILYALMNVLFQLVASFAGKTVQAVLFTNSPSIGPTTNWGNLAEATFGNYSRQTIAAWTGPYYDGQFNAFVQGGLATFVGNSTSTNMITGMAIIAQNGGTQATATANIVGTSLNSVTVTNGGTLYEGNVIITFSGGGMTVAPVVVPVIVNGVITAIDVISGGTFAGTPAIAIETPKSIVEAGLFPAQIPCGNINEPIAVVPQLTLPPTTTY